MDIQFILPSHRLTPQDGQGSLPVYALSLHYVTSTEKERAGSSGAYSHYGGMFY